MKLLRVAIMKILALLLIMPFISGCLKTFEPWVIEANGATIEFPIRGAGFHKTINNSIHGSLTKEQTETFASALPVITNAVYFTNFERSYEEHKNEFSDADVTFFYQFLVEHAITDERVGWWDIKHWNVTPTSIAFTVYDLMENDSDDSYWRGDENYYIKIRYYFVANNQGEWAFVKNEFIGFAPYER
jgi:hypothetical protein